MRTITFDTQVHDGIIKIPDRFRPLEAQRIEVTLTLRDSEQDTQLNAGPPRNARGILGKYKNPKLMDNEKDTWELAVKEKHENR